MLCVMDAIDGAEQEIVYKDNGNIKHYIKCIYCTYRDNLHSATAYWYN